MFRGCWECERMEHLRHKCPIWSQVCGPSGTPPAGHKGARDKAYAKWRADRSRARLKNFEAEGKEDFDDDDLEE